MSEIDTLHALEARTGLLARAGNEHELIENAAAFTRAAALELSKDGDPWGNVRKTSGLNVRGLDVDKVLHRATLDMRDIVIGAGAPGQHVGWLHVATGRPEQWVAAENGEPPIIVPPSQPVLETLEDIRDLLDSIDNHAQALLVEQQRTNEYLKRAADRFGI